MNRGIAVGTTDADLSIAWPASNTLPATESDWQGEIRSSLVFGVCTVGLILGALMAWSFAAPLASAIVVSGQVIVEDYGRTVQYPSQGVVSEISAKNGQTVSQGDVLLRFDERVAQANWQERRGAYLADVLRQAHLQSLLSGSTSFSIPEELLSKADDPWVEQLIVSELDLLDAEEESYRQKVAEGERMIDELQSQLEGITARRSSKFEQLNLITEEVETLRALFEKGYVTRPRLHSMQRNKVELEGLVNMAAANADETRDKIDTLKARLEGVRADRRRDLAQRLSEISGRIDARREAFAQADWALQKTALRAPISGRVMELEVNTIGQVVKAGQTLMTIVPDGESLVFEGEVRPADVNNVERGMSVRIDMLGMPAYSRTTLRGTVEHVSADVATSEPHAGNFVIRVATENSGQATPILPGMPVRMYVESAERSAISFLLSPVLDVVTQSLREH